MLPTVKIKFPANKRAGYAIINEADFDPKRHELFDAPTKVPDGDEPAKTAAEVLAMADGNFMAFKSAAKKLLGDATPGKKNEIIAAVKALG